MGHQSQSRMRRAARMKKMPGVGIQSTHRARRILHGRVVQGGELESKWDEEGVHM